MKLIGTFALCAILLLATATVAREEEELVLSLEKVSAPFDAKAKILVEQKDGKFKEYPPKDHKKFDKEVDDRDLEITEFHIKDRKIVKIVFGKKQK